MTTVKYASETAKAAAKVRAATNALTEAGVRLARANARARVAADAAEKWAEKWPQLVEIEGRPTYESPVDRMADTVEGEPVWIEDGPHKRRANTPDVLVSPPPSIEELDALESAVGKATKALTKAENAAAKIAPETLEATGYEVFRGPQRIGGTAYSPGDPFDPTTVKPDKLNQLLDRRILRRVGHA